MKKLILSVFLTISVFGMIFAQNAAEGQKLLSQGITAEQKGENFTALALYIQARTADKNNVEIKNHIDSMIEVIAKSCESIQIFNKKSSADLKKSMKLRGEWDKIHTSLEKLFDYYTEEKIFLEYTVGYYTDIQTEELTSKNYLNETVNLSVKAPFLYHIRSNAYIDYIYETDFAKKLAAILRPINSKNEWHLYLKTERKEISEYDIKERIKPDYKICLMNGKQEIGIEDFDFINEDKGKYNIVFENIPLNYADTDKITVVIKPTYKGRSGLKSDKNLFCSFENLKKKYFSEMYEAEEYIKNIPEDEIKTIKIMGEFNKYLYPFSRLADAIRQCKGFVDLDISETFGLRGIGYDYEFDYDRWEDKAIGNNGFKDCNALVRIILPKEGFYYLEYGTFLNCSSLHEVKLSEDIKYLGGDSFKGCTALTELCIPKTVTHLYKEEYYRSHWDVFDSLNGSSIQKIYYEGSSAEWGKIETVSQWKCPDAHHYKRHDVSYSRIEIVFDCPAWKVTEIKKAEEERIAAAKKAEEERIATEKKSEEERIAAEQEAENQRLKKFQDYYESGVVPAEDAANFLSTINFINNNLGEIKKIKIIGNVAGEMEKIRVKLHDRQLNLNPSKKDSYLKLALDFSEAEGLTELEEGYFWGWYLLSEITLPKTLIEIKSNAFNSCNPIINYTGSKKEWKRIKIDKEGNKTLLKAKINYDYKAK